MFDQINDNERKDMEVKEVIVEDEKIVEEETIEISIQYKGKVYKSTRKFTDLAIKRHGDRILVDETQFAAAACIREALREQLIKET